MRSILLFGLYFVLSLKKAIGESENEVKRGIYPYMAVVYYPDASIVGASGARFTRNAVIIRSDWLISSSLETNDTQLAFPQKTLMARAGAIVIDYNFTINEDEGEQEREVIQVVRPTNFTINEWWNNDITLLKTLLPFLMTATVASTTFSAKDSYIEKSCNILIFAKKYSNSTEDDKVLIQLSVELLPLSKENCGIHFRNETMICATNSDENKNIAYEPDFCHSNGGGPLICDGDVIGLQTYIGSNCKQPFLYQLLSAWDDFITCGVEEKCIMQQCANICTSLGKDDPVMSFGTNDILTMPTSETATDLMMYQTSEDSNDEERLSLPDTTTLKVITANEKENPTPTMSSTTETTKNDTTPIVLTENEEKTTSTTEDTETSWPKQKFMGFRKLDETEASENIDRTTNVEAQRHEVKKKGRSAAESYLMGTLNVIHSLIFGLFFICII